MKINLEQLDSYDHVEEIPAADATDKVAKIYFRGTRDWLWDFASKSKNDRFELSFQEQYEFLVRIMVKWEGIIDEKRNLPIPFSKERALQILKAFEIIKQDRVIAILMIVWNTVSEREETLKNFVAGLTTSDSPAQDGSKSVLTTDMTQSTTVKGAKKEHVKKS